VSYMKMYFGNAYRTDGMYKISTIVPTLIINEISTSEYSSTLWHNRLGHVNYRKNIKYEEIRLTSKLWENVKSVYKPRSQASPF